MGRQDNTTWRQALLIKAQSTVSHLEFAMETSNIMLLLDDLKKLFSEPKIVKILLVQFSPARRDESNALKKFQKFEIFFVYTVIFSKIVVALPNLF